MKTAINAAPAAPVPLTRADLTRAAWQRFEAARDAYLAREALAAAAAPLTAARAAYETAAAKSEHAMREYEAMEQRMLLQVVARPAPVAA